MNFLWQPILGHSDLKNKIIIKPIFGHKKVTKRNVSTSTETQLTFLFFFQSPNKNCIEIWESQIPKTQARSIRSNQYGESMASSDGSRPEPRGLQRRGILVEPRAVRMANQARRVHQDLAASLVRVEAR